MKTIIKEYFILFLLLSPGLFTVKFQRNRKGSWNVSSSLSSISFSLSLSLEFFAFCSKAVQRKREINVWKKKYTTQRATDLKERKREKEKERETIFKDMRLLRGLERPKQHLLNTVCSLCFQFLSFSPCNIWWNC